ncbi:possible ethyl tert-butyl ether degradation protein EthD [Rhodococcus wratislaviensis]|uniref:Possible ethyl tert-butyl ether degradation protein EthD n=1 Tax=Rhodococcus wratislaviensis TaxID=44752 RepID=A0A402C1C3_RHOWR|nr:EthD family reductase [Rhodococcus wratislaviensis]GCE37390.1 possible ethyl tert-butyl ether degradation protein EthD [Rhodococcus wratislaviensis]
MYRVSIIYDRPTDPAAFDEYYSTKHLPLVEAVPGVVRLATGKCETFDGTTPAAYALAELFFDSKDDAGQALSSSAGKIAAEDLANFATGGVTMLFSNEDTVLP